MISNIIAMSYDRYAFAIRIFRIIRIQFAKDVDTSTIVLRLGIWRFLTSISVAYANGKDKFHTHGLS